MAAKNKHTKKQRSSDTDKTAGFLLRFPKTIDPTNLSIRYFLTGAFGGYGDFLWTESNTWQYIIPIEIEGQPASTLKAILYYPGYCIELLDIPSLQATTIKEADIDFKPLSANPLFGKIDWANNDSREIKLTFTYVTQWSHEFYGIYDGLVVCLQIASVLVERDGTFSLMLPDFSQDANVNRFQHKGMIQMTASDVNHGNTRYILDRTRKKSSRSGKEDYLAIDEKFVEELILYASIDRIL